jgi:hypothetical protein
MSRIGVVVTHGMGSQEPGFSEPMVTELRSRLGSRSDRVVFHELYWANALTQRENALWESMQSAKDPGGNPLPLDWSSLRQFVIHNFGDAVAYHRDHHQDTSAYDIVHDIISAAIGDLASAVDDPCAPTVIVAHSLGCHMMSNYLWDREHAADGDLLEGIPTLAGFVTFGCNIPLFRLSYDIARPMTLPGSGLQGAARDVARWLNFFDRDDVLGWPMRPLFENHWDELDDNQRETVRRLEDHEINVGSVTSSWNLGAHAAYWTDNDFTIPVARYLDELLDTLD